MSTFVPKGIPFAVLQVIPVLGPKACGTEIADHLVRHTGRADLVGPKIYTALIRLSAKGLVKSALHKKPGRGHPRRVYKLTQTGRKSLEAGRRLHGVAS